MWEVQGCPKVAKIGERLDGSFRKFLKKFMKNC
jgi:hypothetical protein